VTKNEKELWNKYQQTLIKINQDSRSAVSRFSHRYPGKTPTSKDLLEFGYDADAANAELEQSKQLLLNAGFTVKDKHWVASDGTDVSKKGVFSNKELVNDPPKRDDGRTDIINKDTEKIEQAKDKVYREIQESIDSYFASSEKTSVIPQIQKAKSDLNVEKEKYIEAAIKDFSLNSDEAAQLRQDINSAFDYNVEAGWNKSYNKKPREAVAEPKLHVDEKEEVDITKKYKDNIKSAGQYVFKTAENTLEHFKEAGEVPSEGVFDNYIKTQIDLVTKRTEFFPLDATDKEREVAKNAIYNEIAGELINKYRQISKQCKVVGKSPNEIIAVANDKKNNQSGNVSGAAGTTKPKVTTQNVSSFAKTNVSFSGCDMVITAEMVTTKGASVSVIVGEAQTISYSIYRKLSPILNIGNINAKDYVGGPRTIAGSLVMTVFNQHWGTQLIDKFSKSEGYASSKKVLMDELAPINITISMANEYGICSRLAIYGVRIFSEGQVMSINDIFTENTFQYVALNIDYLADVNTKEDLAPLYRNTPVTQEKAAEVAPKNGTGNKDANGNVPPNQGGGDSVKDGNQIQFDPSNKGQNEKKEVPQKNPNTGFTALGGEIISYASCGDNKQGALQKAAALNQDYIKSLQDNLGKNPLSIAGKDINKELDKIKRWYANAVKEITEHYENIDPADIRTDRTGV